MDEMKKEQAEREAREDAGEVMKVIRLVKMALDAEEPGLGDMFVNEFLKEMKKLQPATEEDREDNAMEKNRVPADLLGTEKPAARGERYIGTKLVEAWPAARITDMYGETRVERLVNGPLVSPDDKVEIGYRVRYEDGYVSWSPAETFEKAYRPVGGMSFGLAIEAVKQGKTVARMGWNGKNQRVELAVGISYEDSFGRIVNAEHAAIGNAALAFVGTSGVQLGWLASQADMLADDWYIVE